MILSTWTIRAEIPKTTMIWAILLFISNNFCTAFDAFPETRTKMCPVNIKDSDDCCWDRYSVFIFNDGPQPWRYRYPPAESLRATIPDGQNYAVFSCRDIRLNMIPQDAVRQEAGFSIHCGLHARITRKRYNSYNHIHPLEALNSRSQGRPVWKAACKEFIRMEEIKTSSLKRSCIDLIPTKPSGSIFAVKSRKRSAWLSISERSSARTQHTRESSVEWPKEVLIAHTYRACIKVEGQDEMSLSIAFSDTR